MPTIPHPSCLMLTDVFPVPADRYGIIYIITHRGNGKQYIGQTVRPLKARLSAHCARSTKGISLIGKAIAKYGPETFEVETLDWAMDKEGLDAKERHWIATLTTISPDGYNLKEGGGNGRPHPESVEKGAAKRRGRKLPDHHPFKQKGRPSTNKGKKMSPEQIEQNRQRALARFASGWVHPMLGYKMSPEQIEANRQRGLGRKLPDNHPFKQKGTQWSKGRKVPQEQRDAHSAKMKAHYVDKDGPNKGKVFKQNRRAVICVETGQRFESRSEAAKFMLTEQGRPEEWKWDSGRHIGPAIKKGWRAFGYHWREADGSPSAPLL